MLTRKQLRMLQVIVEGIRANGVPPSYEEVRTELGLASKSSVHRMMLSLEERGYIRRLAHKARAIEVIRTSAEQVPGYNPWGSAGEMAPVRAMAQELPVLGHVAAGSPVVVWENAHRYIGVPQTFVHPGSEYFALEVRGDSMVQAGIHSGDIGIIRRQEIANDGDIVVALIDNDETTLKRFGREGKEIVLRAENGDFEDLRYAPDRVSVQGRLTGLLRNYD